MMTSHKKLLGSPDSLGNPSRRHSLTTRKIQEPPTSLLSPPKARLEPTKKTSDHSDSPKSGLWASFRQRLSPSKVQLPTDPAEVLQLFRENRQAEPRASLRTDSLSQWFSSMSSIEDLDFASVQRGNPEIEHRCQEVIDQCWQLGDGNPIQFIQQTRAEISKVVWPTRREVLLTTVMVFIMATLTAIFFALVDLLIRSGLTGILGLFG